MGEQMQLGGVTVTWNGEALTAQLAPLFRRVLEDAGRTGIEVARARARVDTGAMRDSLRADVTMPEPLVGVLALSGGAGLPDARLPYNELGTAHLAAQPMLRPGADAAIKELRGTLGAH